MHTHTHTHTHTPAHTPHTYPHTFAHHKKKKISFVVANQSVFWHINYILVNLKFWNGEIVKLENILKAITQ